MPRVSYSLLGDTPFQQLLGHQPDVMKNWNALGDVLSSTGNLSEALKEQVRRVLAFGNGCEYCMAKGKPDESSYDEKTSVAVAFADIFLNHPSAINDDTFEVLRQTFTEKEIVELCSFICFTSASQRFGAMMDLKP